MQANKIVRVALVDDHKLFRKGMVELINDFPGFAVVSEAENGKEFTQNIAHQNQPDIVLLDISMPVMDGFETAQWMEQRYPDVKILALSMHNDAETVMKMLKSGVNGYVLKNADPSEVEQALKALEKEESYYPNWVVKIIFEQLNKGGEPNKKKKEEVKLSEREITFLKLACSELPYKSFSPFLGVTTRVVESTREVLFKKLEVSSRVGLVLYAIKNGYFIVE